MAPERAPAFQFYPKDFLTDVHVVAMNSAERGAYITLLCLCWLERSLPVEPDALARLCRVSPACFARLWPALEPCFSESNGRLVQPRMERERQKQDTYRSMKAAAGKQGGRPKADDKQGQSRDKAEAKRTKALRSSSSSPISDLQSSSPISDLQSPDQERSSANADFETFRAAYPVSHRTGGKAVKRSFSEAMKGKPPEHLAVMLEALDRHKRSEQWAIKGFIPSMTKWLAEERWTQELPEPAAFGTGKTAGNVAALQRWVEKNQ